MEKRYKIILIILILIIISGIITLGILGFNKSVEYKAGTRIEVYIPQGYDKQDIIDIAKECFNGKNFSFEKVEKLNQVASIKIEDYTDEELNSYKEKISEKYEINKDELVTYEISLPKTRVKTIVMPYVLPISIVTMVSLIYIGIRNIKSKKALKTVLKTIAILALVLGIYFSLIVIFRLPFGKWTMPLALAIYIISLIVIANNINK